MLPKQVRRLVEEISSDTRSGALPLALRTLEAYELLGELVGGEGLKELHQGLDSVQPLMAPVRNASAMARTICSEGKWDLLSILRQRLSQARHEVARKAADLLRDCETLMTISFSSDVRETLEALSKSQEFQVYVCESRPLQEGLTLTKALRGRGIDAIAVVDAAGPSLVSHCDAVVTGADALLRDGRLVNKIGSLALALACEHFGIPCRTMMELAKVELEGLPLKWQEESRNPNEIADGVRALNFYFETIPGDLVDSLTTDGPFPNPEAVLANVRTEKDLLSFYLGGPHR